MQDKQQIYGRNDMVMLYKHNKIYGSLGLTEQFVFDTINGENTVVLNNPKVGKFKDVVTDLNILGNSHQDSTTGKQLFDVSALKNISGFSVDEDGFIMQKVYNTISPKTLKELIPSIEAGKSYYLSVDNPDDFTGFFGFTGSVSDWYKNQTFVPKEDDLNIRPGIVSKVGGNARYRLMITEGQTASPYEPYTGGKPSPSHDYPQQIKNVGKWNEKTQKYEVDVKVTGKNLFNKELAGNAPIISYKYIPIRVGKGAKVSVSYSKQLTTGLGFYVLISKDLGSSSNPYVWLYHSSASHLIKNKYTFTAVDDVISLSFAGDLNSTFENMFNDLQIEISDTPTEYEPYKEQTATIAMDEPLRGIGKYQDKITKDGIARRIRSVMLNGNEDWKLYGSNGNINNFWVYT